MPYFRFPPKIGAGAGAFNPASPGPIGGNTPALGTFSALEIEAAASPTLLLTGATSANVGSVSMSTDVADSGHDLAVLGLNMKLGTGGFEAINVAEDSWGMIIERDFVSGTGSVQHEAYYSTESSERPFTCGFAPAKTASVTSVVAGAATISAAGDNFLPSTLVGASGLKFRFTDLGTVTLNSSGISTGTYYFVLTRPTPTTFTFSATANGAAITGFSATGATMQRGGYGNYATTVPMQVSVSDYGSPDIRANTAFEVVNTKAASKTQVVITNEASGRKDNWIYLDYPNWVLGTDIAAGNNDNFFLMSANGQHVAWMSDINGNLMLGRTGYTHATGAATLDVTGTAKVSTSIGVEAAPTAALLQVGSVLNPAATADIFLGGHSGGSTEVTRIRTGSYDNNAQYGFFLKTTYASDARANLGVTSGAVDYVGISILKTAAGATVSIPSTLAVTGAATFTSYHKNTPKAFASLTAAATAGSGARDFINNCSHSTFATDADGAGALSVPVYSDGATWKVG